jgi:acetylglutamate kinase
MIRLTPSAELARAPEVACPMAGFTGNTVVVNLDGAAMERSHLRTAFSRDVGALRAAGVRPIVVAGDGQQIDADLVAGEIAAALAAVLVIYLADAPGILDRDGSRFRRLSRWAADSLVREGMIDDGMRSKIEGAVRALKGGAAQARIIDGRMPHALARALRSPRGMMGTEIVL